MKTLRALFAFSALALVAGCGSSPLAPQVEPADPLLDMVTDCQPPEGVDPVVFCRGYIGSGS